LIDIFCPHGAQQQTRRTPLLLSIDGIDKQIDRQTDGRPFHRPFSAFDAEQGQRVIEMFVSVQLRKKISTHACTENLNSFDRNNRTA